MGSRSWRDFVAKVTCLSFGFVLACEERRDELVSEVPNHDHAAPIPAPPKQPPAEPRAPVPPPWSDRLTKGSGFPCDVETVLAASCRRCHWQPQEHDAPFALVKWEDTQRERQGSLIWELMKKQIAADLMPPLEEMVSPPVTPLTPEQKKSLLDWLSAGAKRTTEACESLRSR